jgi:type IV pilus assembly protein PilB
MPGNEKDIEDILGLGGGGSGNTQFGIGMHNSLLEPEEEEKDKDKVLSLMRELGKYQIVTERFGDSDCEILTLDELISKINEVYPNRAEFLPHTDILYRAGVLPLLVERFNGQKRITFALKMNREDKPDELRDPSEIDMNLSDQVCGYPELQPEIKGSQIMPIDQRYILVSSQDFEKLRDVTVGRVSDVDNNLKTQIERLNSRLDRAKAARMAHLGMIDEDKGARDGFYALLASAIQKGASDIHIEPMGGGENRVRFRIHGVLATQAYNLNSDRKRKAMIQVVKADGKLNLAEHRRPQDGKITFVKGDYEPKEEETEKKGGLLAKAGLDKRKQSEEEDEGLRIRIQTERYPELKNYNLRISTLRIAYGEKSTIRILRAGKKAYKLEELGFKDEVKEELRDLIRRPSGIVLLTGPTGSGKTTTLYAALQEINKDSINITTVEDPIEVPMSGINQTQINDDIGYGFSTALRYIMRQDPDVILIGEMRDAETAKAAIEAAKTGHLVFSTLHARNAQETILRLKDLGVSPIEIQSCLLGVVSQRLIRTLCNKCKQEYDGTKRLTDVLGEGMGPVKLFKPREYKDKEDKRWNLCGACKGLSYGGRTVVPEVWLLGREERKMISGGCMDPQEYLDVADKKGRVDLMGAGMGLVLDGRITLDEYFEDIASKIEVTERKDYIREIIKKYQAR